ncbi:AraC-like ligand-binding domain-containing protein [Streptomyces buecherae]|uniref:AraC-like ligand-binding domain-containing protein n=1 Tax=Streptomyces buecherae TaxID=2763006 RepID=UPI0027DFD06E|nr:AraC family transcriptional regulator [Streptomyces buecherae]
MTYSFQHGDDLPREERFDWWCEVSNRTVSPARVSSEHLNDFSAHLETLALGGARLTSLVFSPVRAQRTAALVNSSDPEEYELVLAVQREQRIAQERRDILLAAGEFALRSTSRPYDCRTPDRGGPGREDSRVLTLRLPRGVLPLASDRVDRLLVRTMSATLGTGAVLADFLRGVLRQGPALTPVAAQRIGATAVELAASVFAHHLDADAELPPEARHRMLLARIERFIEENLPHSHLTPAAIAAHHHISLRFLHALFRARQRTVAATIRHRRLERCRADLADARAGLGSGRVGRGLPAARVGAGAALPARGRRVGGWQRPAALPPRIVTAAGTARDATWPRRGRGRALMWARGAPGPAARTASPDRPVPRGRRRRVGRAGE